MLSIESYFFFLSKNSSGKNETELMKTSWWDIGKLSNNLEIVVQNSSVALFCWCQVAHLKRRQYQSIDK